MDLPTTESYTYNSSLIRNHLNNPKLEGSVASSFLHLIKILEKDEEKEGAPIENYDFAGNLPLIISYLYKVKSHNTKIYQELINLLQVGLSDLTKKCRNLQKEVIEQEKIKGIGDIPPLIVDTSLYEIDNLNVNAKNSLSNDKSEVTIAHDAKKNYYAIKRFKRNIENSDKQKSILRNVLLYSQLKHYSIVPFVGINLYYRTIEKVDDKRAEGRFFYPSVVTKYQKKKSLYDILFKTTERYIFTDTQKMIILLGVSTALKYLHKKDITHGNLKPSNVLINKKFEPFVSDFFNSHLDIKDPTSIAFIAPEVLNYDLAKQAATTTAALTKSHAKNTSTDSNTTTPTSTTKNPKATSGSISNKMASTATSLTGLSTTATATAASTEAATEKKKVSKYTKEADVYSFGMIVYSVLTSQAPFALESHQPKNLIKKINSGTRPEIPIYIPTNYAKLIDRCWRKDPSERPTMKEIVDIICETDFLPETDIKEFGSYIKKVRPSYIMPALVRLKSQQNTLTNIDPADQRSSSQASETRAQPQTQDQEKDQSQSQSQTQGKDSEDNTREKTKSRSSARSNTSGNGNTNTNTNASLNTSTKDKMKTFNSNSDFDMISEGVDLDDPESIYQYALKIRPKSIPQSNKYMQMCAEMGHTRGQVEYGKILLDEPTNEIELSKVNRNTGDDLEANLKLNEVMAAHYFKLASGHDDPEALYLYGRCLYYGVGVRHDYAKAAKYLERAAFKQNKDAQYLYALCLEEGNGVPQNIPLAIKFYTRAERNDVVSATRHLAGLGAKTK